MIALDTNVLARYIVRDDPRQTATATGLIESMCTKDEPGIITITVLCELVWVLDCGYKYDRPLIANTIKRILSSDDLLVEQSELAWQALNLYMSGKADFADYVIGLSGKELNAKTTYTFDKKTSTCGLFTAMKL